MITDTLGLMLFTVIHPADIQDRDGAPEVLKTIRHRFPSLVMFSPLGDATHRLPGNGRRLCRTKVRAALKGKGDWTIEM